jgi:hypothetical protein
VLAPPSPLAPVRCGEEAGLTPSASAEGEERISGPGPGVQQDEVPLRRTELEQRSGEVGIEALLGIVVLGALICGAGVCPKPAVFVASMAMQEVYRDPVQSRCGVWPREVVVVATTERDHKRLGCEIVRDVDAHARADEAVDLPMMAVVEERKHLAIAE